MELDKFGRQLRLISLLARNTMYHVGEIGEKLGLSPRSVYRYIDFLRDAGFTVVCNDGIYSIDSSSAFIQDISERVRFTGRELEALGNILNKVDDKSPAVQSLKKKLSAVYGVDFMSDIRVNPLLSANVEAIHEAIVGKRKIVMHDYFSPHSGVVSDRVVEPFRLLMNDSEVRCFEIASAQNKTFKISRIQGGITVLPDKWEYTSSHMEYFTDIFGFSGEKRFRVKLLMGLFSANLLMEEYPVYKKDFVIVDDRHWLISLQVCGYQGLGRFVAGLMDDIRIVDSDDFKNYMIAYLHKLTKSVLR